MTSINTQTTYEEMIANPHTNEDRTAAVTFFAGNVCETWFQIPGKFSINREDVTDYRYDQNQGGWAWL